MVIEQDGSDGGECKQRDGKGEQHDSECGVSKFCARWCGLGGSAYSGTGLWWLRRGDGGKRPDETKMQI